MNNSNHPTLSDGNPTCPGKAIFSELNYEKLRNNRLKELEVYYSKILHKYEENKREFDEKTIPDASNDAKQESEETIKPTVIRLNNQLLEITTKLVNNNEHTGKGLMQQYQDLKIQETELNKLMNNVDKLEEQVDTEKNTQLTRETRMKTSYDVSQNSYYWYMGLVMINFILILFLIIYMILILKYTV
jgi:hypothetical protein